MSGSITFIPPAVFVKKTSTYRARIRYGCGNNDSIWHSGSPVVGQAIVGANQTVGCIIQIAPNTQWIRFEYTNGNTSGNRVITNAAYAPTSLYNTSGADGAHAYNATGVSTPTLFNAVTFNNGGADISLAAQLNGTQFGTNPIASPVLTLTIPPNQAIGTANAAAANAYLWKYYYSDWMPFSGFARLDGGPGWLLNVRTYEATSGQYVDYAGLTYAGANYTMGGLYVAGNSCISPFSIPAGSCVFTTINPVHGIECITSTKVMNVLNVGDSINAGTTTTNGSGTVSNCSPFSFLACQAINLTGNATKFVNLASTAVGGSTSAYYCNNAYNHIKATGGYVPDVVFLQAGSENDAANTTAQSQFFFQNIFGFAEWLEEQGSQVIFTGAPPYLSGSVANAPNLALEASRLLGNVYMKQSGIPYIDLDGILSTGPAPGAIEAYIPAYTNVPPHPNDAGHAAVASVAQPILLSAMGV